MTKPNATDDRSPRQPSVPWRWARWAVWPLLVLFCSAGLAWYFATRSHVSVGDATSDRRTEHHQNPVAQPTVSTSRSVSELNLAPYDGHRNRVDQLAEKHDATHDDWDTEVTSQVIDAQLKKLSEHLQRFSSLTREQVTDLVDDEFRCSSLRPSRLRGVFDDGCLSVDRWNGVPDDKMSRGRGPSRFIQSLASLLNGFGQPDTLRAKFKLYRIEQNGSTLRTRIFFEASNRLPNQSRQLNATWLCQWTSSHEPKTRPPKLLSIELVDYEQATINLPNGRLFADCTASVLGQNASYRQQVVPGIPHWLTRIGREFMGQIGYHGMAVGDVNGDGLDDLYVCDAGGLPNRLYVQQADGTAVDVSRDSGVDLLEDSFSALLVDLDNDGDQDLVVSTDPVLRMAENDGSGRFELRSSIYLESDAFGISAADVDNDRKLDIYVCGYTANKQDPVNRGLPFPLPYHDANNGGRNYFLRNEGGFQFRDVTERVGLDINNSRFSFAASWEDFDNDHDLDLYVANDFGRNNLYRNDDGRFTDVAAVAGVEDHASGMSVSWGDANRDGLMDVYISNMFSAAGNRVTYQRRFSAGLADATVTHVRRMARGNTLFLNRSDPGQPAFEDVSDAAHVTMGRWAWASRFADLNNDGWQDLVVANGYITNHMQDDL